MGSDETPLLVNTVPDAPGVIKVVVDADVWTGIRPLAPPDKFSGK